MEMWVMSTVNIGIASVYGQVSCFPGSINAKGFLCQVYESNKYYYVFQMESNNVIQKITMVFSQKSMSKNDISLWVHVYIGLITKM